MNRRLKRLFVGLLLCAIVWAAILSCSASALILGDANLDGYVKIDDASFIQMALAKFFTPTDAQIKCGNVNGSDRLDISDATYIQMYLAHFDLSLPIGCVIEDETTESTEQPTQPTQQPSTKDYSLPFVMD